MAKRWTLKDDEFLVAYAGAGSDDNWLNYIASHDLGHHGKNAGRRRMQKLRETGLLEKIEAAHRAHTEMVDAWGMAFGPDSWKELILERQVFDAAFPETSRSLAHDAASVSKAALSLSNPTATEER